MTKRNMVEKKAWSEFRNAGLLWFTNMILHTFGWSIVLHEDGEIVDAYPARVAFRGFSEDINSDGYRKVSKYLKENIQEIEDEANDSGS